MNKAKLKELINIETGSLNVQDSEKNGKYPFFSRKKEIYFLNEYTHDKEAIIVAGEGDFTPKYINGKFALHQRAYALSSTTELLSNKYLYYFIHTQKKILEKYSVGTTVQSLRKASFEELEISLPPLHEQQKIASVLSALDDQIELNNKINQALEDFAQTLYNYWFVQFEFPNKEGKPYKSSGGKMVWNEELKQEIPEGWEVKKLSNLSKVLTGKKDANFANKEGKYKFFTCSQEVYKCDEFDFDGDAILIAGNGDFNVKTYSGKFNAYQRTYVVLPNNKIHYSLIALSVEKNILSFKANAQGSIVKFIKKGDVEEIRITIPNNNRTLNELNQIRKTIQQNKEQIEELAQLRDYLLPLLMNGQVGFSDEVK